MTYDDFLRQAVDLACEGAAAWLDAHNQTVGNDIMISKLEIEVKSSLVLAVKEAAQFLDQGCPFELAMANFKAQMVLAGVQAAKKAVSTMVEAN